jgi:uncharacterized MAPEG superfamily protein
LRGGVIAVGAVALAEDHFMRMTLAYFCVLLAALLPIVCAGIGKMGQFKVPRKEGGFDNHDPRAWWAKQTGFRARANAAQANTFEALPFFFAAVIIAHMLKAPQAVLDLAAFLWIMLRACYVFAYLGDAAKIRSLIWVAALIVNIGIFFLGTWK